MKQRRASLRLFWRRLSRVDLGALLLFVFVAFLVVFGKAGAGFSAAKFLGTMAAIYLLFRLISWWRAKLLWSLRNRLIIAYLFIALVPVLLVVVLASISAWLLYVRLGGYLLYQDVQQRVQLIADGADHISAALKTSAATANPATAERIVSAQEHAVYDSRLPGLQIEFADDRGLYPKVVPAGQNQFAGLIQESAKLSVVALQKVETAQGNRTVVLRASMSPELVGTLTPELGPIEIGLLTPAAENERVVTYTLGGTSYKIFSNILGRRRPLRPAAGWWDPVVSGVARFEATLLNRNGSVDRGRPVIAFFKARPSQLNDRMFSSVGELGRVYVFAFAVVSVFFLVLEIAALTTGVVLTRRITKAVDDLYRATQFVQKGDFTHRVLIERRDQLGVLGESFNQMIGSISGLIEEQKKRQRLENEISIAREVQNQLFPQILPAVPGVEIEAICKAARMVSGDYYDFIQLSPTHLAIAIADISGKGISAALLMASLQAALRSQVLAKGSEFLSTAELVSRLNNHLVRNTGDDRFATFFIAVYDSGSRTLRYTNAGHLPSFCICDGQCVHLDRGGMVLGVIEDYEYEQGQVSVPVDAMLIGYSDGLVEPENAYGEEFGIRRLQDVALRAHGGSPRTVAETLMMSAEDWAGTPEQADDMTVIVARLR